MISLNGVAVPHYTLDQLRWVEKRIPPSEITSWDWSAGRQGVFSLMLPPRIPQPPVRIGVLHWPKDACRWATFHAILTEDQIAQIDPHYPGQAVDHVTGSSVDTDCNVRDWTLVLDEGNPGRKITTVLHPLSPVPLQDISGKTKYLLVTLVDERYYWWTRAGRVTVTEGLTTWLDTLHQIAGLLEISPVIDTISPDFDRPSRLMRSDFLPLPLLLDAAALAVGMRVIRQWDGTVVIHGPEVAKTDFDSQVTTYEGDKLAGGQSAQAYLLWDVPEKICVAFNKINGDTFIEGQFGVTIDLNDTNIPEYMEVGGRCGTLPVFAQALATYSAPDGSGTPTNASTLQTYAKKWAEKYYRWQLRRPNLHYAGVVPFDQSGLVDAIEVHHHAEPVQLGPYNPGAHRVTTRILPVPWDWRETGCPRQIGGGGDSGFHARLTKKTYPAFGGYIEYNFDRLTDTDDPVAITWTDATQDPFPAYELNNIDVPVSASGTLYSGGSDDHPTIVRMYKGAGDYYLFDSQPRWEFVKQLSPADTNGRSDAASVRYDQDVQQFKLWESGFLLDVNSQVIL